MLHEKGVKDTKILHGYEKGVGFCIFDTLLSYPAFSFIWSISACNFSPKEESSLMVFSRESNICLTLGKQILLMKK